MPQFAHIRYALLIAALAASSGCLIMRSKIDVVRQSEERRTAQFQSSFAQRTFQSKALDASARESSGNVSSVTVPFLLSYNRKEVRSENAFYNDQLQLCDLNGDNFITDEEAMLFSGDHGMPSYETLQGPRTPDGRAAPEIADSQVR